MSNRFERTADKKLVEKHQKILKDLLQKPENKICADCKKRDPRWASANLGIFICLRCSGIHRSLGVHISKVRSIDLDTWTQEHIDNMVNWGNARANKYWEHGLPPNHIPEESKMEQFIRSKYEYKKFVMPGPMPNPETLDSGNPQPFNTSSTHSQPQNNMGNLQNSQFTTKPFEQPKGPITAIAYKKQNLTIQFTANLAPLNPADPQCSTAQIVIQFLNTSSFAPLQNVQFQVAVPISLQLNLLPPEGPMGQIMPGQQVIQKALINNPIGRSEGKEVPLKLKLKVTYIGEGGPVDEIVEFAGFPNWKWI